MSFPVFIVLEPMNKITRFRFKFFKSVCERLNSYKIFGSPKLFPFFLNSFSFALFFRINIFFFLALFFIYLKRYFRLYSVWKVFNGTFFGFLTRIPLNLRLCFAMNKKGNSFLSFFFHSPALLYFCNIKYLPPSIFKLFRFVSKADKIT